MRRTPLVVAAGGMLVGLLALNHCSVRQRADLGGLWGPVEAYMGEGDSLVSHLDDRETVFKIFTARHFVWVRFDTTSGALRAAGGGTYDLAGDRYVERLAFFSEDSTFAGRTLQFEGRLTADTLEQSGTVGTTMLRERWVRLER